MIDSAHRVFALLASIMVGSAAGHARDFIAADSHPADHPTVQAMMLMDRLVRDKTDDRHRINIHYGGILGEERATFEQTRLGAIDINRTNLAPLTSFVGEVNVLGLPFLFRSTDHLHKALDGPIGEEILQGLAPHGFVALAFYESGARSIYTVKRPVRMPQDLRGLRIRVQQSDLMVDVFKIFGAEPVLLPYTLTKIGLETGLIDAAENNWPSYVTSDHYAAAPYYTLTEHVMTPDVLVMSSSAWNSLSAEDRQAFRSAARESSTVMRSEWETWVAGFRKHASELGVTLIDIDQKPFESALMGLYEQLPLDPRQRFLMESIRKIR